MSFEIWVSKNFHFNNITHPQAPIKLFLQQKHHSNQNSYVNYSDAAPQENAEKIK